MTDPSQNRKKKITITASPQGVERAENALIRLGFDSKSNFAQSQLLARNTVTKFFQREPIQLDSFKRICEALKLKWIDIAEEEQSERIERKYSSSLETSEVLGQTPTPGRQVIVIDTQSKTIKAEIVLRGDINSIHNFKILQLILQEHSGDTITITDIQEGSIRLIVEGSQEDIERLVSRIKSGELTEVNGFPVEDAQILSEISDDDESNELDDKWRLVQEIVSQPVKGRNLSGVDLSDADLNGADLSGADLSDADLSGADLSGAYLRAANLSRYVGDLSYVAANLSRANLIFANLSAADLSAADLSDANLILANLSDANLILANLSAADLSFANLSDANLSGANLKAANLRFANLSAADLRAANLSAADLSFVDLRAANLRFANLSAADLRAANLSAADLSFADLSGADLSGADLSGADLSGANLSGANLSDADLSDAIVVDAFFGGTKSLTEDNKRDLKQRGAIFGDEQRENVFSDRPPVPKPK
ncbi:MAG: pentapeptide repeat-containing protein [Brasilonema octagenarum HA4186-MV1]|nr:pentapeptide repeat-containing protein [Brasilonema octagenarum HA4186-MV1]